MFSKRKNYPPNGIREQIGVIRGNQKNHPDGSSAEWPTNKPTTNGIVFAIFVTMKKLQLIPALLLLLSTIPSFAQTDYGYKEGFNLVWHDEFIDSNTTNELWRRTYPWGPMYTDSGYGKISGNHIFENGQVSLMNRREFISGEIFNFDPQGNLTVSKRDFNYTFGMLYGLHSFTHGYFEAGFQSDPGKGFYNAFWLVGDKHTEVDIFELQGSDPFDAQMTLHWQDPDPFTNSRQSIAHYRATRHFGEVQHRFGLLWTESDLKWFHDGVEIPQTLATKSVRRRHIPDVPLNVVVNSAIGGIDGVPNASTKLPGKIAFDFVRVYQNETTVEAPEILGHKPASYTNYEPTPLSLDWLVVKEHYKTFPYGFTYQIQEGSNYTTNGSTFTVTPGFKGLVDLSVRVRDGINWSASRIVTLTASPNVGVSELANTTLVNWYPNPSEGLVNVENGTGKAVQIEIRSIDGKLQFQSLIDGTFAQLNLSSLSKGMYTISIVVNNVAIKQSILVLN